MGVLYATLRAQAVSLLLENPQGRMKKCLSVSTCNYDIQAVNRACER